MTEQKINRNLAEWTGFTEADIKKHYYFEIGGIRKAKWREPGRDWYIKLPRFTQSLDACFKWLMPKAIDEIMIMHECSSDVAYGLMFKWWLQNLELDMETPALALCRAILKLIEAGK